MIIITEYIIYYIIINNNTIKETPPLLEFVSNNPLGVRDDINILIFQQA